MVKSAASLQGIQILPHVKHYAWGGKGKKSFLRRFLGSTDMTTPFAEAWYGTHPQGPSMVDGTDMTLTEFLRKNPGVLGRKNGATPELPFMVKIIEARLPLSLQVHPNKKQAVAGFRRENAKGIPLDSPDRCFRDRNAKPEVITALTRFDLFAGFELPERILKDPLCRAILAKLGYLPQGKRGPPAIKELAKRIFSLPHEEVKKKGGQVFNPLRPSDKKNPRLSWLKKMWKLFGAPKGDPATMLLPFLVFHRLRKGQSLPILPGVAHTYLEGVGVEVMGCSDNVLRLGLTDKNIDPFRGLSQIVDSRQSRVTRIGSRIPFESIGELVLTMRQDPGLSSMEISFAHFGFILPLPIPLPAFRHPSSCLSEESSKE